MNKVKRTKFYYLLYNSLNKSSFIVLRLRGIKEITNVLNW